MFCERWLHRCVTAELAYERYACASQYSLVRGYFVSTPVWSSPGKAGRVVCSSVVLCYVWCYLCCASQKRRNVSAGSAAPRVFCQSLSSPCLPWALRTGLTVWSAARQLALWAGSAIHLTLPHCPTATSGLWPQSAPFSAPRWWVRKFYCLQPETWSSCLLIAPKPRSYLFYFLRISEPILYLPHSH